MNGFSLPVPYSDRAPRPRSNPSTARPSGGRFRATLTLLNIYQGTGCFPQDGAYSIGLLCDPPLEGTHIREPNWIAYKRHDGGFISSDGPSTNPRQITFLAGEGDPADVKCVGVFRGDLLCFYGRVELVSNTNLGSDWQPALTFAPGAITLLFR